MTGAPVPFSQFVLKVASRCDLACDHCYVYEHEDQSWRGRPAAMGDETVTRTVARIAEHAAEHRPQRVAVVLHGGEPLLFGIDRTRVLLSSLRTQIPAATRVDISVHTNAVRLDSDFLDLFLEFGVRVGVSLDGGKAANDLHRRFANGRSSHKQALRALSLLREPRYRSLYAGILCTVDVRNDPVDVYDALAAERPPRIDLLLPHATWDHPPFRRDATGTGAVPEYAAWLAAVYDRWSAAGRPFPIRTFESVADLLRGRSSGTEALGLAPRDLVVIETDGAIEQADSLKTAFDGAAATEFDVFRHSLDQAAAHAGFVARQGGVEALSATCQACRVVEVCGGGMYAHRYRSGVGFDQPSVYCEDLMALIDHVRIGEERRGAGAASVATHKLPVADFEALASGLGDEGAVRRLAEPQASICRALVEAIGGAVDGYPLSADAWREIVRLDKEESGVLADVLADPYTRVWAVRLLERADAVSWTPSDLARLTEIAASAALRSGSPVRLPVQVVGGVVHLPTVGALVLGGPDRVGTIEVGRDFTAVVTVDGRGHRIGQGIGGDADGSQTESDSSSLWQPQRHLEAGTWSVALEDTDPYRDCHQWPAASRLSTGEAGLWARRFADAASYIEDRMPRYLPGLRAGLRSVMPMVPAPSGTHRSGTARHAFGSVGVALPADGPTLALLLVHEFQHVKLGALLDIYDFYDSTDNRLFYVPWREDPRPLEGLIQGTYAHLAVTDFWRTRREDTAGEQRSVAEANFARWRRDTGEAVETVLGSGSLSRLGERFVRGMAEAVTPWLDEPVSLEASAVARLASESHRAAWERRRRAAG